MVKRTSPISEDDSPAPAPGGGVAVPPLESISIISNDSQKSRGSQNSAEDRVPAALLHPRKRSPIQLEEQAWVNGSAHRDSRYVLSPPPTDDGARLNHYHSERESQPLPDLERYRTESPTNSGCWVDQTRERTMSRATSLFTFGPSESLIDFHILAIAGKTFDEGRFSSSKLIMDGFDYEFREMRSKKVLAPGQLGDVGTMAKNIARSFILGHQSRTIRIEIVNPGEIVTLGPRLTHIMLLVGLREEKEPLEAPSQRGMGSVVTIKDGKYKGCRGILRQINDGNAMVRVATGDSKGKYALIPESFVEIMDESELLMHVASAGRPNKEMDNLLNASVDNDVLHSFQSDMFDDHLSVNDDKRLRQGRTRNPSIPQGDFLADISEHLANSFDPELYQIMESDKMGNPKSHGNSVHGHSAVKRRSLNCRHPLRSIIPMQEVIEASIAMRRVYPWGARRVKPTTRITSGIHWTTKPRIQTRNQPCKKFPYHL